MRMTKQRKNIIAVFEKNPEKALSAEMIHQEIADGHINLSTVYRTMDKLIESNLINKAVINSTAYFYLSLSEHKHFMICTQCQKMIPIGCMIGSFLPKLAESHHFKITGHDITIFGFCQDCHL